MYAFVVVNDKMEARNVLVVSDLKKIETTKNNASVMKDAWERITNERLAIVEASREQVYKADYTNCRRVS